jgi:hypothetical protein
VDVLQSKKDPADNRRALMLTQGLSILGVDTAPIFNKVGDRSTSGVLDCEDYVVVIFSNLNNLK